MPGQRTAAQSREVNPMISCFRKQARAGGGLARAVPLAPGLWFVATPTIGGWAARGQVTLACALDTLALSAEVLVAEDDPNPAPSDGDPRGTRKKAGATGRLIRLSRPLMAPEARRRASCGRWPRDAASPTAHEAGKRRWWPIPAIPAGARVRFEGGGTPVSAAPGPTAAIMALSVSGLPSDRFLFSPGSAPPAGPGARARWIDEIGSIPATLILYESPKRVHRLLGELCEPLERDATGGNCAGN